MSVKSLRIPEDIERAIGYVAKLEKIEKSQSLRKLTLSETLDLLSAMGGKGNIRSSEVLESLRAIR
ncbi:MAG: hypothetical protein HY695_33245 [Deltaproteobacteria bacterium]|nr:hypothetical protein [Deltaproteobacteria bacterium]